MGWYGLLACALDLPGGFCADDSEKPACKLNNFSVDFDSISRARNYYGELRTTQISAPSSRE